MNTEITTAQRLIVAADYSPQKLGISGAYDEVMSLAENLQGTGVIIKLNSFLRHCGYQLIDEIHDLGLEVFADLKLVDIPQTMEMDAEFLAEYKPEFLTVMCNAGNTGMNTIQKTLPETQVLGITVLTSLTNGQCYRVYNRDVDRAVLDFAKMAQDSGLSGIVSSAKELPMLVEADLSLSFNTPGIRPWWTIVPNDDQSHTMTPEEAMSNGATRVIIGRPIITAKSPLYAVKRTLDEIEGVLLSQ